MDKVSQFIIARTLFVDTQSPRPDTFVAVKRTPLAIDTSRVRYIAAMYRINCFCIRKMKQISFWFENSYFLSKYISENKSTQVITRNPTQCGHLGYNNTRIYEYAFKSTKTYTTNLRSTRRVKTYIQFIYGARCARVGEPVRIMDTEYSHANDRFWRIDRTKRHIVN